MVTAVLWSLDAMIRITLLYTTQFENGKSPQTNLTPVTPDLIQIDQ